MRVAFDLPDGQPFSTYVTDIAAMCRRAGNPQRVLIDKAGTGAAIAACIAAATGVLVEDLPGECRLAPVEVCEDDAGSFSRWWTFDPASFSTDEAVRYLKRNEGHFPDARQFKFAHLRERAPRAATVSEQFARLAAFTIAIGDDDHETAKALSSLLIAKDAAVRSALP